jgi:hypothetical protein
LSDPGAARRIDDAAAHWTSTMTGLGGRGGSACPHARTGAISATRITLRPNHAHGVVNSSRFTRIDPGILHTWAQFNGISFNSVYYLAAGRAHRNCIACVTDDRCSGSR